jgi:tetratricopeptide (TPR) repeat protein
MKKYLPWIFIGFLQTVVSPPSQAAVDGPVPSVEQSLPKTPAQGLNEQSLIDHGQALYDQGQFSEAAGVLNQALEIATQQGDRYSQVLVFRNLALVDLQQGYLDQAEEFIQKSLALVPTLSKQEQSTLQPSLLEVEGGLQVQQGKANQAYTTWEKASGLYEQLGKQDQANRIRINQAYALQQLGFYPRAIALLTPIADQLNRQPDSISKATTFRSLGEALYSTGDMTQAEPRLVASLEIAQRLRLGNAVSQAQISLANLKRAQSKDNEALVLYRQAAAGTTSPLLKVQSEVNELGLLIETGQFPEAQSLWPKIQAQLDTAPTNRDLISARINLATRLMSAGAQVGAQPQTIYELLAVAVKQSQAIKDSRIESFALGTLGKLYEQQSQFADAVRLTERALQIAQNSNSLDILYRWQWQLGRIYKAQSELASNNQNLQRSIDAYSGAIKTLRSLRTDLLLRQLNKRHNEYIGTRRFVWINPMPDTSR